MSSKVYKDKHDNIIKFNPYEKKRRYEVNGEIMNGCTSIIDPRFGKDGLVGWAKKKPIEAVEWQMSDDGYAIDEINKYTSSLKDKVKELSERDAKTGTMMHQLCEDLMHKKKIVIPKSEPLKTMFKKFKVWWGKMKYEVIHTERTFYSEELQSCGTVDLICKKNGKYGIIDFKTSKTIEYANYPVQLFAYKKMVEDSTNLKIEFLGLLNIPKDKEAPISFMSFNVDDQDYLEAFKLCLKLKEFEKQHSVKLKEWKRKLKTKKGESDAISKSTVQ